MDENQNPIFQPQASNNQGGPTNQTVPNVTPQAAPTPSLGQAPISPQTTPFPVAPLDGIQPAPPAGPALVQPPAAPNPAPPVPPVSPQLTAKPSQPVHSKKQAKKQALSTQDAIQISEIRDGLVIMRDGSMRAVVMCQSINFDLMSPQERSAVEYSYQGFLNSLGFTIQIFIRSQRVDLNNYIDKLKQIHSNQENILLGLLMEDYIAYVRYLIEAANVMDKQFYVIVPYYPPLISQEGIQSGVRKFSMLFKNKTGPITINEADYTRYKSELTQRVQTILSGMSQMGVQAVPLNTQELIELYYSAYNPQTASRERLTNMEDLETPVVTKGTGQASQVLHGEQT